MYKGNRAFSLLEVLTVISLIGIMVICLPISPELLSRTELQGTVDRIVSDLRWARAKAIIDNKNIYFRIYNSNKGKSKYIFYCENEDGVINIIKQEGYPEEFCLYKNLSPVRIIDEYYDRILFTGYGTARGGTIGLSGEEGVIKKIVVSQMGRIRLE